MTDAPRTIFEVRWNPSQRHFDVITADVCVQFHETRAGALAAARWLAQDAIAAGRNAEIIVVEPDGSHVKDRL